MTFKVAILGGGVAGLSAAHELVERGYDVTVYEQRSWLGGKARSIDVPDTASPTRRPLPGEHGFRFFPGFYRHLTDTLGRIPFGANRRGVLDNLVPTSQMLLARDGQSELVLPSEPPDTLSEARDFFIAFAGGLGIPPEETLFFSRQMMRFLTSCDARRKREYDQVSWWDFVRADEMSEAYRKFLGQGATRSLVAMRAEVSSTRTIATIYFQMLSHLSNPFSDVDRLLDGPTNDVWIDPWEAYLTQHGVQIYRGHRCVEIKCDKSRVTGAVLETDDGTRTEIDADFYVAALPVEVMVELLNDELREAAPSLEGLPELETAWMNGCQFFLDHDARIAHGHGLYLDSPWALTSISQAQFWDHDLARYGDGRVDGILSICISDWETPGVLYGRPAKDCTAQEIQEEVWAQLIAHLHDDDVRELERVNVLNFFLDDSIVFPNLPNESATNLEPLLINTTGSWAHRPEADLGLPNFFLASDYVRTHTDLATMESANEAARRAVNGILARSARPGTKPCKVWPLYEWPIFYPFRWLDSLLFRAGKPPIGECIDGLF